MLTTDAYAFLNINDPVCAWATYRGTLVSPPAEPGFVSVWAAGLMRSDNHLARVGNEWLLEQHRAAAFPSRVSRLRGMFCFLDLESAERACSWATNRGSHFRPEYLAELNLSQATLRSDRLDANWISYAKRDDAGRLLGTEWIHSYWAGEPYPHASPIWETLIDGRMIVLGTALRERAYLVVKRMFPQSLGLLEIARLAAWVGSDLGNSAAHIVQQGNELALHYFMDMRDANNPNFLAKLEQVRREGHPTNWADLGPHLSAGSFGQTPDLRPFEFKRPLNDVPYIAKARA